MPRFFAKMLSSFLFVGLISTSVYAQQQTLEFQVDRFEPLPAQGTNTLNIAKSDVLPAGSPSLGFFINYASNGFNIVDSNDDRISRLLENQLRADVWFSMGVFDFMDLGFVLPIIANQTGDDLGIVGFPGKAANGGPELGDLRVVPKIRLINAGDSGIGLAIVPTIGIPTGSDIFNSDGGIKVEPRAVLDWRSKGGFAVSLNGAYLFRPQAVLNTYVSDDVVRWGAGLEIPVGMPELKVLATGFGDIGLVKDNVNADSVEADGAIQYTAGNFVMLAGGGAGINNGVGNPEFRVFGSLGYTPMASDGDGDGVPDKDDNCPTEPEDIDGFEDTDGCPDLDNDADGIADKDDLCTDEPEDIDNFEDDDGCPENDNDGDGVGDGQDKCPNEAGSPEAEGCPNNDSDKDGIEDKADKCPDKPEDIDGFEDEDGCPETDNDSDGILDADDKCPNKAEDKDGFEDGDGCPDLDNDKDGIPDSTDQCPNKPEVINGNKDDDGCPDKGPTRVKVTKTSIQILDKVFFQTGKDVIEKRSFNILNQVASILKVNPQITKIRIEGHTDDRGDDKANLSLSQKRADAVLKYLVVNGVASGRLMALGFGETTPIADNKKSSGRASNRRVEFKIAGFNGQQVNTKSIVIETKKVVPDKKTEAAAKKAAQRKIVAEKKAARLQAAAEKKTAKKQAAAAKKKAAAEKKAAAAAKKKQAAADKKAAAAQRKKDAEAAKKMSAADRKAFLAAQKKAAAEKKAADAAKKKAADAAKKQAAAEKKAAAAAKKKAAAAAKKQAAAEKKAAAAAKKKAAAAAKKQAAAEKKAAAAAKKLAAAEKKKKAAEEAKAKALAAKKAKEYKKKSLAERTKIYEEKLRIYKEKQRILAEKKKVLEEKQRILEEKKKALEE